MSKKRQDLELELRKLDIDRRDVDVRIRSIEASPRNQRILKGDFSRPPPREGDTRRFRRGPNDADDTPSKRPKEENSSNAKEEETTTPAGEKEEEKDEDEKEEESAPAVLSAVVVNEEPETKEESVKPERGKRKITGKLEARDKRMFSNLLMNHLNQAQKRLKVDRTTDSIKRKEEMEAKVSQKISQRTVGIREKEAEHLAQQRDQEKKLRDDIIRKEETKRRELDELIILEHEELLSNFIRTQTEPVVYYLPASHTEKSKKLLAKTKEFHDARVASGSAMEEKELDQGFIAELFKVSEEQSNTEKAQTEDTTKENSAKEEMEKDQNNKADGDQTKDTEKDKKRDDSPPKKPRKKVKEESSSSSSDSSDSD